MSLKVNYTLDLIKEVPILFFCVCRSILGKSMLRDIFLWKLTLWLFFFSVRSYLAELSNLDSPFKILFSFLLMQKNPEQNKTGVHEHSAPLFSSLTKPAVKILEAFIIASLCNQTSPDLSLRNRCFTLCVAQSGRRSVRKSYIFIFTLCPIASVWERRDSDI